MNIAVKSPGISRMGGKTYLTRWLCEFIPEHERYIEPFAGGAKLFFYKESSPIEILNDREDMLINLYKVIQHDEKRQRLIKLLNEIPYSRNIFNHFRKSEPQGEIEKAARYFYLCKASFAGDVKYGGFATPSRSTTRNPAMTYQNSIKSLNYIAQRLKGVTIECLDYKDCISRYDSESSLFYIDCPYYGSEDYYGNTFTEQDHYNLSNILHSVKAKVMLSHYQCETYDKLYSDWNKYIFESFKGSYKADAGQKKPKTVEVLFTSFSKARQRSLFNV
ncbi:MAG: DNA adenine methylase [Planctomycetia bacterium]|nr:DNA adenine methylase [Planctomycetia bacterium]